MVIYEPGNEYKTLGGDVAIIDAMGIDDRQSMSGRIYRKGDRNDWMLTWWNSEGLERGLRGNDDNLAIIPITFYRGEGL